MYSLLIEIAKKILDADETDVQAFHQLYDQFVWFIATASRDELKEFGKLLFTEPYSHIPIPLQTLIFRLLGLEFLGQQEQRKIALTGIEMYCDPVEQNNASKTIKEGR